MSLLDAQPEDLAEWQADRAAVITARTLRTKMVWLRGFYAWAVECGVLAEDPSRRMRTPKVPRLLPRPLSEDKLATCLANADARMRALLLLAAFAGLRAAEIAGLAWTEVQLEGDEPTIRVVGKGAKERIIDVSPMLRDALLALPHRRGPVIRRSDGGHLPNTPNNLSKVGNRYLRDLGIPDTLHSLRHRFGTQVARVGGIRVAQEALGHASVTTAALYAEVARRDLRPVVVSVGEVKAS
jgi:integrase/recombinase XerC